MKGVPERIIKELVEKVIDALSERKQINLDLLDYMPSYDRGPALTEIATYQPPEGVGDTKLTATKEDYENIRIGTVSCERESESTVVVHATVRYKPDDEDAHKTDQWGYTETEPMPAMRLTDLSETEADLVEAFVPVAVEEADGFAGFRETATKTNSLVDRLEAITLPDPDDVAEDVERYREAVERAEELDEKIRRTDDLIDEIVYDLYGLTDEEIEIVEDAVGGD
ncbi:MAG: restriction endonuclease [Haloarculaceae archaeon]